MSTNQKKEAVAAEVEKLVEAVKELTEDTPATEAPVESKSVVVDATEPISFGTGSTPPEPEAAPEPEHPDFLSDSEKAKRRLQVLL